MSDLGVWKGNIFSNESAAYTKRGYVIGSPQATETLSADVLGAHGMVGIYLPEGANDPGLERGALYFEEDAPAKSEPVTPASGANAKRRGT